MYKITKKSISKKINLKFGHWSLVFIGIGHWIIDNVDHFKSKHLKPVLLQGLSLQGIHKLFKFISKHLKRIRIPVPKKIRLIFGHWSLVFIGIGHWIIDYVVPISRRITAKRRKLFPFALLALVILIPVIYFILKNAGQVYAAPWATTLGNWSRRKQLTLVNNAGAGHDLHTNSTYQISIDTKTLVSQGLLKPNCDDLRIVYQPNDTTATELKRAIAYASGAVSCSDSSSTIVSFPLQADLTNAATNANYYMYYSNNSAPAYSTADALSAYNIGAKSATFVAPFNGTTTALAAGSGTPTAATGAIRYSGAKSALSFNGVDNKVVGSDITGLNTLTVETWIYPRQATHDPSANTYANIVGYIGTVANIGALYTTSTETTVRFAIGDVNVAANYVSGTVSLNSWSHVAGVYDGTNIYLFINGTLAASKQLSASNITVFNFVGANGNNAAYRFDGLIDEVRVSNTSRYTSNFTPLTTPFVRDSNTKLLLHFDENGDDPRNTGKAIDDSGNGNNGTITGAKYVGGLVGVDGDSTTPTSLNSPSQSYASHQGVFIEEGTTNKITNPSFEHTTFGTNWSNPAVFDYDSSADTFIPAIAKRNSAGPFAAGVMVQGESSSLTKRDVISITSPDQLGSLFYSYFDMNQGSVVFWITPEWNGNDGLVHTMFDSGINHGVLLWKTSDNKLSFYNGAATTIMSVDVSSWVAGSTYSVVVRWDTKNPLYGTNYASISINNSHSFGRTTPLSTTSLNSNYTHGIGSATDGNGKADAIIEGLTVYRRPLYETTTPSGINVGNGDEISQIYGGGTSPKDPTLVTGSWDVVFALPTNASTGTLGATGEAWSHPHSTQKLYTSTTNTGGFMMGADATTDGWTQVGTPTAITAIASAHKIFAGGYYTTSDAANEGMYRTFAATNGGDYVLRALGNSDGTCNPQIKVTRADGTTEITHLNGTTTSTRTAPDVYIFTWESPAAENEQVQLINTAASGTCYWHQVEVQSNWVDNPSLETGSGDPWHPATWVRNNAIAGDFSQELSIVHSGSSALKSNLGSMRYIGYLNPIYLNSFVSIGVYGRKNGGLIFDWYTGSGKTFDGSDTWKLYPTVGHSSTFGVIIYAYQGVTAGGGYFDDLYETQLDNVTLTVTPASEANSAETSGLRVDGNDTLTQPVDTLTATSGTIKFKFTPRHSLAVADKFGSAYTNLSIFWVGGSSDYIRLTPATTTSVLLRGNFNGTTVDATWPSATLDAGTTYDVEINYTAGGSLNLKINGTQVATNTGVVAFGTVPTIANFGANYAGAYQYDATYAAPSFTGTVTRSENTAAPYYKFGSKSVKLVAGGDGRYITSINPGNVNTHTLSAYVYDGTTGNVGGSVSATVAKLIFNGSVVTPASYTDMGGGWWRLTYSAATANAAGDYGVAPLSGKTIYVDGVQLEEKAYATTYADGTMGTGYAWDTPASPHNSTSTRTAANVQYSATNNISSSTGTISLWVNRANNPRFLDTFRGFLSSGDTGGSYSWILYKQASSNLGFYRGSGVFIDPAVYNAGWNHIVVTWNGTAVTLYLNYTQTASGNIGAGLVMGNAGLQLAYYLNNGSQTATANSALSDLRIYNSPLSSTDVADLYYAGLGSHSEQTAIDRIDPVKGQNPVANYHFDEGTGSTAYDSSIYHNNATLGASTAAPTWSTEDMCVSGKCLKYDGNNDVVTVANTLTGVQSVAFWAKPISNTSSMLDLDGGTHYISSSNGTITAHGFDNPTIYVNGKAGTTLTANTWNFIEITTATAFDTTSSFSIGKANGIFFNGWIDELKIYPAARTAAQVKVDYNGDTTARAGLPATSALADGLVGYWKMDENTGTSTTDSSGAVITENFTGSPAPTWASGKFSSATSFNGSSSYLVSGSVSFASTAGKTGCAWINPTAHTNSLAAVFRKVGSFSLRITTDGKFNDRATNSSGTNSTNYASNTAVSTGSWSHVCTVWESPGAGQYLKLRYYINGVLDRDITTDITDTSGLVGSSTSTPIYIGQDPDLGTRLFNGKIDEVRIYNRALSSAEVTQLYQYAPGPVAHWKFDEGSGQSALDSSGNSNTGTLGSGATADSADPTWTPGKIGGGLKFDGSDDYIKVSPSTTVNDLPSTGDMTVETWINVSKDGTYSLLDKAQGSGNGWWLWQDSNKVIKAGACYDTACNHQSSAITGNNVFNLSQWTHITAVYLSNTKKIQIFINGIQMILATDTAGSGTYQSDSALNINFGDRGNGSSLFMTGYLDGIRIYNYARTPEQITQDMQDSDQGYVGGNGQASNGSRLASAVAYYRFDEGYGSTVNNSGSGGSILNGSFGAGAAAPTWTNNGKYDKALSFDGNNDYINLGSNLGQKGEMSISAWVNTNTVAAGIRDIVANYSSGVAGDYALEINRTAGKVDFIWDNNITVTSNGSLVTGNWYHIVGVRSGASGAWTAKIYINGKLDNTATIATNPNSSGGGTTTIGKIGVNDAFYWNGLIDEVKIYDFALTADEVKTDYNQGSAMVLGSLSTSSTSNVASNSSASSYCPPGSTDTCIAPVAEWNFEEGSGQSANDTSGNANTGTLGSGATADSADPTWTPGKIGGGLKFDGSDDYVNVPDNDSLDFPGNNFTLQTWVKMNSVPNISSYYLPLSKGANTQYGIRIAGKGSGIAALEAEIAKSTGGGYYIVNTTYIPMVANKWYFLVVTFNGTNTYSYVNGVYNARDNFYPSVNYNPSGDLKIGRRADTYFMNGLIDGVRIYNYVRTPAQIAWDYNQGKTVAEYRFDECTGTVAHDSSGNGNNGTITIGNGAGSTQSQAGNCDDGLTTSAWYNGKSGKQNYSLNLDGVDDSVSVGTAITNVSSVSFWIKPASTTQSLIDFDGGTHTITIAGGTVTPSAGFSSPSVYVDAKLNGTIADTNWHQVTVTTATAFNSTAAMKIGLIGASYYSGQIDDVRVFNYALTATQVKTLFNSGAVKF